MCPRAPCKNAGKHARNFRTCSRLLQKPCVLLVTEVHTHTHTRTHARTHAPPRTPTHAHARTPTHAPPRTPTHTHTHPHPHPHPHPTHPHTHTHTHTHTRPRPRTRTHTHTQTVTIRVCAQCGRKTELREACRQVRRKVSVSVPTATSLRMLACHFYSNHENRPARNDCSQGALHCGECPDRYPRAISMLCLDALWLTRSLCACLQVPGSMLCPCEHAYYSPLPRGDNTSFHALHLTRSSNRPESPTRDQESGCPCTLAKRAFAAMEISLGSSCFSRTHAWTLLPDGWPEAASVLQPTESARHQS